MTDLEAIRAELQDKKAELERRIFKMSKHAGLLSQDFQDAATELENDEVLQGLDDEAREELQSIHRALLRIDNGTYGICSQCGVKLSEFRIEAAPFAEKCVKCSGK